jgi:hypothetical protein
LPTVRIVSHLVLFVLNPSIDPRISRSPGLTVKISRNGGNVVDEVMGLLLSYSFGADCA